VVTGQTLEIAEERATHAESMAAIAEEKADKAVAAMESQIAATAGVAPVTSLKMLRARTKNVTYDAYTATLEACQTTTIADMGIDSAALSLKIHKAKVKRGKGSTGRTTPTPQFPNRGMGMIEDEDDDTDEPDLLLLFPPQNPRPVAIELREMPRSTLMGQLQRMFPPQGFL
jgi:hypothetical protein